MIGPGSVTHETGAVMRSVSRSRLQCAHADQVVGRGGEGEIQSTSSPPRCRSLRRPPTVFSQPKISSIRLRFT